MKCTKCGNTCSDHDLFCAKCGTPVNNDTQYANEAPCEDNAQYSNDTQFENATKYSGEVALPDNEKKSLWHKIPTIYLWLAILSFAFSFIQQVFDSLDFFHGDNTEFLFFTRQMIIPLISLVFGILLYTFMRGNQIKKIIIVLCVRAVCSLTLNFRSAIYYQLLLSFGHSAYFDFIDKPMLYGISQLLKDNAGLFMSTLFEIIPSFLLYSGVLTNILMLIVGILVFKFRDKPWMKYKKALTIIPVLPSCFNLYIQISRLTEYHRFSNSVGFFEYLYNLTPILSIVISAVSTAAITYYFIEYRKTSETSEKVASDSAIIDESIPKNIRSLRDDVIIAGKSPLFTIAISLFTAITLLSLGGELGIIKSLATLSDIDSLDFLYYGAQILSSAIEEFLGKLGISIAFFRFIITVPPILTIIALWMIYFSVRKGGYDLSLAAKGCKIIMAIQAIICLAKSILWFAVIMLASEAAESTWFPETFQSVACFALIALIVTIVYGVTVCNALKSAIHASTSDEPAPVSGFLTFICICDGILTILSSGFNTTGIIEGAALILFGLVLSKFRNNHSTYEMPNDYKSQWEK